MAFKRFARRNQALLVLVTCGAISVGLDLDHVIVCVARGVPLTWENLARHAGRPLHIPALVVACLGSVVSSASLVRRVL